MERTQTFPATAHRVRFVSTYQRKFGNPRIAIADVQLFVTPRAGDAGSGPSPPTVPSTDAGPHYLLCPLGRVTLSEGYAFYGHSLWGPWSFNMGVNGTAWLQIEYASDVMVTSYIISPHIRSAPMPHAKEGWYARSGPEHAPKAWHLLADGQEVDNHSAAVFSGPFLSPMVSSPRRAKTYKLVISDIQDRGTAKSILMLGHFSLCCAPSHPTPAPVDSDFGPRRMACSFAGVDRSSGPPSFCGGLWMAPASGDGVDFAWVQHYGSTPTQYTGPSAGPSGNNLEIYLYVEASNPHYPRKTSHLISTPGSYSGVSFKYHMYGDHIGTLALQVQDSDGTWWQVWHQSGQVQRSSSEAWREVNRTFPAAVQKVRFVSVTGQLDRGDIALADVQLYVSSLAEKGQSSPSISPPPFIPHPSALPISFPPPTAAWHVSCPAGTVTASAAKEDAFSWNTFSRWLDFPVTGTAWIQIHHPHDVVVTSYSIASPGVNPGRDPRTWRLLADVGSDWQQVDSRSSVLFAAPHEIKSFVVASPREATIYRLVITDIRDSGSADSIQISNLWLYCAPGCVDLPGWMGPPGPRGQLKQRLHPHDCVDYPNNNSCTPDAAVACCACGGGITAPPGVPGPVVPGGCLAITSKADCCGKFDGTNGPDSGQKCYPSLWTTFPSGNVCEPGSWIDAIDPSNKDSCAVSSPPRASPAPGVAASQRRCDFAGADDAWNGRSFCNGLWHSPGFEGGAGFAWQQGQGHTPVPFTGPAAGPSGFL